jgi:hypothetical protein
LIPLTLLLLLSHPALQFPTTWMHEIGHNLYLNHAGSFQPAQAGGSQYIAYKDDSGAMGHCCSTRCFNAPHSYQLGWSKAVDSLDKENFPAGKMGLCGMEGAVSVCGRDLGLQCGADTCTQRTQ